MDASQYKDYVLTMLFVKYVSDKYANNPYAVIDIPKGASFEDMIALKGKDDIGDKINKQILQPLFAQNNLEGQMELVDFNDDDKLGSGQEKIDTLSS
jgi:type I restriction enzyme M protein